MSRVDDEPVDGAAGQSQCEDGHVVDDLMHRELTEFDAVEILDTVVERQRVRERQRTSLHRNARNRQRLAHGQQVKR